MTMIRLLACAAISTAVLAAAPAFAQTSGGAPPAARERMQERYTQMQSMMNRAQKATTPAERQKLMAEHMKTMQEQMAAMHGMMGAGGMMGQSQGGGAALGPNAPSQMMQQRMDMMQQMMEQMMAQQQLMMRPAQ
jgi:hypothetical protein